MAAVLDWVKITPWELVPAIKSIRRSFQNTARLYSEITKERCYAALHPAQPALAPDQDSFGEYLEKVGVPVRQFQDKANSEKPPVILAAYFSAYLKGLKAEIRERFDQMLKIGVAKADVLKSRSFDARCLYPTAVEWAREHLRILIHENAEVEWWIRTACDHSPRKAWCAPRLIQMPPLGNIPYDRATAWEREDETRTQEVLKCLTGTFCQRLESDLRINIVGPAHESLAAAHRLAEQKAEPLSAKVTTNQGAPVSRRHHRPIDARKELIASLKARRPNIRAREICKLIDNKIEREPAALRPCFEPLPSWVSKAGKARTWLGLYDNKHTRNLVRSYVNKVPPLKTAAKSST